jgi:hypothetical protein
LVASVDKAVGVNNLLGLFGLVEVSIHHQIALQYYSWLVYGWLM